MENPKLIGHGQLGTLQNICVDCILKNFESFMAEYHSGEHIPPRYFEFLQRTHSKILFEYLLLEDQCFARHLDFIFNPHLKEIDLDLCNLTDVVPIVERLKNIGSTIKVLAISGNDYTESLLLELIDTLPNVEALSLVNTDVTAEVLRNIGNKCHDLNTLKLAFCPNVTDSGLKNLCRRNENENIEPNLTLCSLDVSETSITEEGLIFALKHFPNLTVLHHDELCETIHKMHINDFLNNSLVDVKYNLRELTIYNPPFLDDNNSVLRLCLMICPHIKKLNMSMLMTQTDVDLCAEFSELEEIYFSNLNPSPGPITVSHFLELRGQHLTVLDLTEGHVSAELILKHCPKLVNLSLHHTEFEPLRELEKNNSTYVLDDLQSLVVENSNFENPAEEKSIRLLLAASPNLEKIYFPYGNNFTVDFCRFVAGCRCMKTVRDMDMSYTNIPFHCVKEILTAAPRLQSINMQNCDISYFEYEELISIYNHVDLAWRDESEAAFSDYNAYDYENGGYFDYDYFEFDGYDDENYDQYDDGDIGYDDGDMGYDVDDILY